MRIKKVIFLFDIKMCAVGSCPEMRRTYKKRKGLLAA